MRTQLIFQTINQIKSFTILSWNLDCERTNSCIFAMTIVAACFKLQVVGIKETLSSYMLFMVWIIWTSQRPERDFVLSLSALEIYNETVVDLLNRESGSLRLLDDPEVLTKSISHAELLIHISDLTLSFLFFFYEMHRKGPLWKNLLKKLLRMANIYGI